MPVNPYDLCPCGSGKKFKWCCTAFFDKVERAFDLAQQNQHEAAIKLMEQTAQDNASNPAVWGFYANLLYSEGKAEEAEQTLDKAFAVQPNYAMGHLLKGVFRQREGEIIGALMLFRKAADAFSPDAADQMAQVHEMIAQNEAMLNRPIAARAALERAVHFAPNEPELRQLFEYRFGDEAPLPECARKAYKFRPTAKKVKLAEQFTGKLSEAKAIYEKVTEQVPEDPAGWFNLGLVLAWLGQQPSAVEALTKSLELEWDDALAQETGALIEVLRMGRGMESEVDYLDEVALLQIRDPRPLGSLLQSWDQSRRMMGVDADPEGRYFNAVLIEPLPSLMETGTKLAKVVATISIQSGFIRLWNYNPENVKKIATEIRDRLNMAVTEPMTETRTSGFVDVPLEGLAFGVSVADPNEYKTKLLDYLSNFLENTWANRSLKSLSGVAPKDAAGSKLLRKRLLGVVKFIQDSFDRFLPKDEVDGKVVQLVSYDWDRLRHKLNAELQPPSPAPVFNVPEDPIPEPPPAPVPVAPVVASPTPAPSPVVEAAPTPVKRDFSGMNAADLASLPVESLTAIELEEALRTALRQDARELAVKFAKAGAALPPEPTRPDRYPFYACLITAAVSEGDLPGALAQVEAGIKHDADNNSGKRLNDFSLRKAQLLTRKGEVETAVAELEALLTRNPDEPKYYISATEAMLSAKQGAKALAFAEKGLAKARSSGNRDLEGACLELSEAAKKQMKSI